MHACLASVRRIGTAGARPHAHRYDRVTHALAVAALVVGSTLLVPAAKAAGSATANFTVTLTIDDYCTMVAHRLAPLAATARSTSAEVTGRIVLSCNAGVSLSSLTVGGVSFAAGSQVLVQGLEDGLRFRIASDPGSIARECPESPTDRAAFEAAPGLRRLSLCAAVFESPGARGRAIPDALGVTAVYN